MANELENQVMDHMANETGPGIMDISLYEESTSQERQDYDTTALGFVRQMYTDDMQKQPSSNLTFDQWLSHISSSKTYEGGFISHGDMALQDDVKGTLSSTDKYRLPMGDLFQNVYSGNFGSFISSAMKGIELEGRRQGIQDQERNPWRTPLPQEESRTPMTPEMKDMVKKIGDIGY